MKHFNILAVILLLLANGPKMCAQTEYGFKEIDVANDFTDNPFTFFADAPILAAADSTGNGYNAMTIDDIQKLIDKDESVTLELKKTTGELKDAMHTACAFLNTDGGWLIFGVTPTSRRILG